MLAAPNRSELQRTISILVVEDNAGDAALIRRMLHSGTGVRFNLIHVPRLLSALETRKSHHDIDIVLLDLNLPDSRGMSTLQTMRVDWPAVPIIILTELEDRQHALDALALGARDFLVKGKVDGHLLVQAILRQLPGLGTPGLGTP